MAWVAPNATITLTTSRASGSQTVSTRSSRVSAMLATTGLRKSKLAERDMFSTELTAEVMVASPAIAMLAMLVEATALGSRMKSEPQPRS